jgi:DNA-binding IclR family transcriptional regulator
VPTRRLPHTAAAAPLVPAVTRALTLLDRLAQQREPMSLAQLTHELALPKSSVHGLCNTLMSFGYLRRQPDGAFLIGPRVMSLAEAFVSGTDVAQEFNALWADAGFAPEETVVLSVLSGGDALYVAVRNSARPLGWRSTSACGCRPTCPAAAARCSPSASPTTCASSTPPV